jgi:hypothetical protein
MARERLTWTRAPENYARGACTQRSRTPGHQPGRRPAQQAGRPSETRLHLGKRPGHRVRVPIGEHYARKIPAAPAVLPQDLWQCPCQRIRPSPRTAKPAEPPPPYGQRHRGPHHKLSPRYRHATHRHSMITDHHDSTTTPVQPDLRLPATSGPPWRRPKPWPCQPGRRSPQPGGTPRPLAPGTGKGHRRRAGVPIPSATDPGVSP